MSKSYDNTIELFGDAKQTRSRIMRIVTDSTPLEEPKDPEKCNVFALIKLFADKDSQNEIAEKYRSGGYGYGHAKKELLGLINDYFAEARERRKELTKKPDYVRDVLREGGIKARERAESVMEPVRSATGLFRSF
jgi:tryptophanyl-tRNA synthetase